MKTNTNIFDTSELQFLELLKAGLWEGKVAPALFEQADWEKILTIAEHQTMAGVVGEAIMSLPEECVPSDWRMRVIAKLVRIEDLNKKMNEFLPVLFRRLRKQGWKVWLLKGQGVGRCYPNPLRRQSGDIDVFFPVEKEYHEACQFFREHLPAGDIHAENADTLDFEFAVRQLYVELHGGIVTELNRACHRNFGEWKEKMVTEQGRPVPEWDSVVMPPCHFDAIFILLHTARHYFGGGIGLRQVADWMRHIYVYYEEFDKDRLMKDIRLLGLEKIWKVFGCMAVQHLGYPQERMPLYDARYQYEGETVLRYILDSGNFGYYDASTKSDSKFFMIQRWKAFTGHLQMKLRNFRMFPEESLYGIPSFIVDGIRRAKDSLKSKV